MILKRQENDELIKAMYESSNILASIYDKKSNDLTLIFNKGGQYKYNKVDKSDYNRFEIAESQGIVFNSHIKKYAFTKLEDIDPSTILVEVDNIKTSEKATLLKAKQMDLITTMKQLIYTSDDLNTQLTETQLNPLQEKIKNYITELTTNA